MRRQDDVWQGKELVLGCGRLLDHDIEPGPADPVGDQRIIERVLVDHRAAARADQDRRWFHHCQLARPDQLVRRGVERHMQGDDVRAAQQLGEQRKAHAERVFGIAAEPGNIVILDAHMERLGEACHLLADVAEPDDAEDLVLELVEHDRREIVTAPPPADDILVLPDQSPRDRQHQQQRMLGDRDRVRAAIVADRHPRLSRRFDVEPVVTGAEQLHQLEAGCGAIEFGTELKARAADVIFGVLQRRRELGAVEFGDDEFVTRRQYLAATSMTASESCEAIRMRTGIMFS